MPRYSWNIDDLIFEEDAKIMYERAGNETEAVLISLLWITGARPSELAELTKEKVYYDTEKMVITVPTKKLGEGGDFKVRERTLSFNRPTGLKTNIYLETIIKSVEKLPPQARLLPYTTRWQENVINRIALATIGKKLSPYHFRHSCLSWMARNGATVDMLMSFKGALSVLSVSMYLHAVPFVVSLENQRRSRGAVAPPIPESQTQPPPPATGGTENADRSGDTGETKPTDGEGSPTS